MARSSNNDDSNVVYVAIESFAAEVDGERYNVNKDERIRAGHPLLKALGGYFEPLDNGAVQYDVKRSDVEQATAAPGEKRNK